MPGSRLGRRWSSPQRARIPFGLNVLVLARHARASSRRDRGLGGTRAPPRTPGYASNSVSLDSRRRSRAHAPRPRRGPRVEQRPWAVLAFLPLLGVLAIFSRERQGDWPVSPNSTRPIAAPPWSWATSLAPTTAIPVSIARRRRVGVEVGGALGLDATQRRNLEFGALLHDVGKVTIPKEIINKPGTLDAAEWAIVKTHTLEGQQLLDRVGGFMSDVGLIVRSTTNAGMEAGTRTASRRADPLEARIVCCCDAWSAMTTTRSYRNAMPIADAVAEMRRCAAPSSTLAWSTLSSNASCSHAAGAMRTTHRTPSLPEPTSRHEAGSACRSPARPEPAHRLSASGWALDCRRAIGMDQKHHRGSLGQRRRCRPKHDDSRRPLRGPGAAACHRRPRRGRDRVRGRAAWPRGGAWRRRPAEPPASCWACDGRVRVRSAPRPPRGSGASCPCRLAGS